MLRRTLAAVFAGGIYVFPGGAVDDADRSPRGLTAWCDGLTDGEASDLLEVRAGGLAYWVAAIRECFEEAGVLLARRADGDGGALRRARRSSGRFTEAPHAVHDGTLRLVDLCAAEGLRLATDGIQYVSHWITRSASRAASTPASSSPGRPRRQEPLHDDNETIASLWVHPADALARRGAGELAHDHADDAQPRVPRAPRHRRRRAGRGAAGRPAAGHPSRSYESTSDGRVHRGDARRS